MTLIHSMQRVSNNSLAARYSHRDPVRLLVVIAVGGYLHPLARQITDADVPAGRHTPHLLLPLGAVTEGNVLAVGREISVIYLVVFLAFDDLSDVADLGLAWGKVDNNLKVRFFEDLARETKLPVVLFQIPVKSYYYDPDTICRIARLENVVAFKEASFDIELFTNTAKQLQRDQAAMRILTGNDRFVAESYQLGAHGALIGVANVATEKWGAMDFAGRAGKFDEAFRIQKELESVKELVFSEPIVEAVARIKGKVRLQ